MFEDSHKLFPTLMTKIRFIISALLLYSVSLVAQGAVLEHTNQQQVLEWINTHQPSVIMGEKKLNFPDFINQLARNRVVFVGEIHDRYDHHLNQLAILQGLHQQNPKLAIGVEWFQQPFQPVIDEFLAGKISESELLRRTDYFDRWRYDYRMLRPIMEYAKANHLPVIALNAPAELTRKISRGGLQALKPEERAQLPATITPPDESYRQRLEQVFAEHTTDKARLANFMLVQRVWDETMAQNISRFLQPRPDWRMVVFSGIGHITHGNGIPQDIADSNPNFKTATIVSTDARDIQPGLVDYFLLTQPLSLPATGKLGVWLHTADKGVRVGELTDNSPARRAGLKAGDRLVKLDGIAINNMADLMLTLADREPGQKVKVDIERKGTPGLVVHNIILQ